MTITARDILDHLNGIHDFSERQMDALYVVFNDFLERIEDLETESADFETRIDALENP